MIRGIRSCIKRIKRSWKLCLKTPFVKSQCLPPAGSVSQKFGVSIDKTQPLIDIDSDLWD